MHIWAPAHRVFIFCLLYFSLDLGEIYGQEKNDYLYPDVPESTLYETKWQYQYTLHVESQTMLHKAGDNFKAFYYFRLDKKSESAVNGKYAISNWSIKGPVLQAPVLNTDSLLIVKASETQLILEVENKSGKGHLQYFLTPLSDDGTIFKKPEYLLPELTVESKPKSNENNNFTSWFQRMWERLWGISDNDEDSDAKPYINIEIIGGGYFGGIDPAVKNYIRLKNNGRLIREYATTYQGQTKTTKNITRQELESLAEYLDVKGFFGLQSSYGCVSPECNKRMLQKPMPVPLRISVTYGLKQKVVSVSIYGLDERNIKYLPYPSVIDNLVETLNRMANRLE